MLQTDDSGKEYQVCSVCKCVATENLVTLSGQTLGFGNAADGVTLQLIPEGYSEVDYEVTVEGNSAEYSIEGVAPGVYTLKIMKPNHVTRKYTVVVGEETVIQDVKICLTGDVTGDGRINIADTSKVYAHVKGTGELTDYAFDCGDVTGDGRINIADTSKNYAHVKGTNKLF